ncbi:MAG: CsiV family protein, partial [Gammaproteobacteria bacterium]
MMLRKHRSSRSLALVASTALISGLQAQSNEAPVELTHYRVEVLVFRNLDTTSDSEDPGRPPLPPRPESPFDQFQTNDSGETISTDDGASDQQPVTPSGTLENDQEFLSEPEPLFFNPSEILQLDEVATRIRRSRGYRLLLHESWRQPGFAAETAQPVDIIVLEQLRRLISDQRATLPSLASQDETSSEPAALTGSITLYRSRYLHLKVDLAFMDANHGRFMIQERRRMRSGELHYLDS